MDWNNGNHSKEPDGYVGRRKFEKNVHFAQPPASQDYFNDQSTADDFLELHQQEAPSDNQSIELSIWSHSSRASCAASRYDEFSKKPPSYSDFDSAGYSGGHYNNRGNEPLDDYPNSEEDSDSVLYEEDIHQKADRRQSMIVLHSQDLPSRAALTNTNGESNEYKFIKIQDILRRKIDTTNIDSSIETMVNHIKNHENLMHDGIGAEMRRIKLLKEMPQHLSIKRKIKAQLSCSVNENQSRTLGCCTRLGYAMSIYFMKKTKIKVKDATSSMELWYSAIKSIESHFGSGVATYFKFLKWLFLMNLTSCVLSTLFLITPQSLRAINNQSTFYFTDLILGNGALKNSILYYGYYSNSTNTSIIHDDSKYLTYNMPLAYFVTMFCAYVLTFILLSIKVTHSYKQCYIETAGGARHNFYVKKIFCSWDYSIATQKAASEFSSYVYQDLKELLAEKNESGKKSTFGDQLTYRMIQFIATSLLIIATIGIGIVIWVLLDKFLSNDNESPSLLAVIPAVIVGIMSLTPMLLAPLIKIEQYKSKRKSLHVKMIRVYIIAVVTIAVLLGYLMSRNTNRCWQNVLAREIYKIMIFDFLIFTLGSLVIVIVHYLVRRMCYKKLSMPKFDVAQNTLNLIYNQILFWVGFYFSPPLAILIILKILFTFYIKKFSLMKFCVPPSVPWLAAQTETLFLALTFLGMTAVLAMFGYIHSNIQSNACGPFTNNEYTLNEILNNILNISPNDTFSKIITHLTQPGIVAVILISMSVAVYFCRAKAQANRRMVQILQEMLVLQSRDKDFLLDQFHIESNENTLSRRKIVKQALNHENTFEQAPL